MRTYASHGTGRGWNFTWNPLLAALLVGAWATLGACSDPVGTDDSDAGLDDGGGIPDAYVDNGPLDCGVAPWDGSVCVRGRLYDFATEQPIGVPTEGRIVSINVYPNMLYGPRRDDPNAIHGRVVPSGRFTTWTNRSNYDSCLLILDSFAGYTSADRAVNCYAFNNSERPEEERRVYVVSDDVFTSWYSTWNGAYELGTQWPIILGVCRDSLWQPMEGGQFTLAWDDAATIGLSHYYDRRALSLDRMSTLATSLLLGGDNPPGAATLTVVPLEETSDDRLTGIYLHCVVGGQYSGFSWIGINGALIIEEQTEIFILSGFMSAP